MVSCRIRHSLWVGMAVFMLAACGQDFSDEEYLERASNYVAESDFNSAAIELKNALRQNADNQRARLLLGQVYFEIGDMQSSEKELAKIKNSVSQADRNTLMPLLAQVWVSLAKHDQVLGIELGNLEPDNLATVLAAQARSHMSRSELELASRKIEQALEFSPGSVYSLNAKARLLYYQLDYTEADQLLAKLHELDPDDAVSWGLHGDLKRTMGETAKATEYYSRAITLEPTDLGYLMKRAFSRIQSRQYDLAQEDVDLLLEQAPQSTQVNYAQGLIFFSNKRYEEAISAFVVAEPDKFSFPQLLMYLGMAHFENGNSNQAYRYAQDFYAIVTDHPVGNKLLATLWILNGKYAEAEQLIRTVLERYPEDIESLNILANSLIKQQRVNEAVGVLADIVELEPDSARARVRLSVGFVNTGRREEALELIHNTIELDPQFGQADMVLVLTHLKAKDFESALRAAREYQQRDPASVAPLLLVGRVHQEAGDIDAARSAYLEALELEPGDPSANHSLAILAFSRGDKDAARKYYTQVLKEHEHFLTTLTALAALEASDDNFVAMVAYLEEAIEAHPTELRPRIVLARYYLSIGRPDKVGLTFTGLSEIQRDTPTVLRLTAQYQFAEAKYSDARYSMERVLELGHATSDDHQMLAAVYKQLGDEGQVRAQLEKALLFTAGSVEGHLAMATYAFAQADAQLLEKHLGEIEKLSPDNPQLKQLQAAYARVSGDQEKALELFEEIHDSSATTASMLNLQRQYQLSGDQKAARSLLEEWVKGHTEDDVARMALAANYLASNDRQLLVDEYVAMLALDENNVVALNNLAWSLKDENPKLALKYAQRAFAITGESTTVLDTLAMVESANDLHEKAWNTIQEALRLDADNPGFRYHSAVVAANAGRREEAIVILSGLLQDVGSFSDRDAATELMKSLSEQE